MSNAAHKPELLAPAGTLAMGITAFDAGADAVYAGLQRFNARERGANLTADDMSKLIALARRLHRRVYVTVNTLVKTAELTDLRDLLAELAVRRPDAVIAQDLGVVRLLRRRFPVLPIHASTQMGIHNSAGLHVAERMGIARVIIERQTTFEEIAAMRRASDMPIEVFVHGALCCSRSGRCLFSSWIGGWSGNRGRCKQPCRRRYHAPDGNGFFFSPGDLCSIDDLDALRNLGVASLKIEGRLRQPDYVHHAVAAYRTVLDAAPGDRDALRQARSILSGALGRRWVQAFRSAADFDTPVQHTRPGTAGRLCGRVTRSSATGFLVAVTRPFHVGDTIRIQADSGDEGPGFTATRLSCERRPVRTAAPGTSCWVHFDRKVDRGAGVYLVSNAAADLTARIERLPVSTPVVDLAIHAEAEQLTVTVDGLDRTWRMPWQLEPARNRALGETDLITEFDRTGDAPFTAGRVVANVAGNRFLPASRLKALRREFWAWAANAITAADVHRRWTTLPLKQDIEESNAPPETVVALADTATASRTAIRARPLDAVAAGAAADELILPEFCPEEALPDVRQRVQDAVAAGIRRIRVTSLYGFDLIAAAVSPVTVTTSYPLPACNTLAAAELIDLGAHNVQAWIELDHAALRDMVDAVGSRIEVYRYGRPPLLTTRFNVPVTGAITDGRGAGFTVERTDSQTMLLPRSVLSLPPVERASSYIDLLHAPPDARDTTRFNFDNVLV